MKLYRVMKLDTDGKPLVGTKGYVLGVRPTDPNNTDPRRRFDTAAVNPTDIVYPGEGLSTSLDPSILKVRSGEGLFELDTADLAGTGLREHQDHPPHCLIEPAVSVPLAAFQLSLAGTRDLWRRVQ